MDLATEKLLEMHEEMITIREFERQVDRFIKRGEITGTTHLYIGEEAVAVGACGAIKESDYITSTHRGHGHCLAKGADLNKMMAELFGKETGICKGRGGSLHIADMSTNNLGANGIVGSGIPIATGAGLTMKMENRDDVVVCFFGDGAINRGSFHEAVNMASIWDLPVVFICENNQYGMSVAIDYATKPDDLSERAKAFDIPGKTIDGNDLEVVYDEVAEATERARAGNGPTLLIAETYRWKGHSKSDNREYRTKEEEQEWKDRDPIDQFAEYLQAEKGVSEDKLAEIRDKVDRKLEKAIEFAEESDYPALEDIANDVYAEGGK